MSQIIKFDVKDKTSLLDSPYAAPVVDALRWTKAAFVTPMKFFGGSIKKFLLKRPLEFMESELMPPLLVFGMAGGGFAGFAGLGVVGCVGGVLLGPLGLVTAISTVAAGGAFVLGFGNGVVTIARHVISPLLLAHEEAAYKKEEALKALPPPTLDAGTQLVTLQITKSFDNATAEKVPSGSQNRAADIQKTREMN